MTVSRLKAVGLYRDLDFQQNQPDFGTPFELLPPIENAMHAPIAVHEISVESIEETLEKQVITPQTEYPELSLEDIASEDAPHLEQKLMSLPKLTLDKIALLQQKDTFCNNISTCLHCNPHDKYFIDSMGILHKKVINFNSTSSYVIVPKILIKHLLHTSWDSLGHVGAIKLYNFIKRLYYFPDMRKVIHKYVRTCKIVKL